MSEGTERLRAALADRYTIERQLGEGGMATVYLATDLRHPRRRLRRRARPDNSGYLSYYGVTLAKLGDRDGARQIVNRLGGIERSNLRGANVMDQAMITAALGDSDNAVRLFQEAFDQGASHGVWIHRNPALDDVRSDPRFQALMRPR